MAEQYFQTQFSTVTNPVQLRWYVQSNPLALVGTYDLPFPNLDGQEMLITGLSTKLHRYEFWEMSSGSPVFMIGKPIYMRPKGNKFAVDLFHYTVGGPNDWDPVPGSTSLTDERLNGKTFHVSQRVNDWRQPSDYAAITGGGFQLLTGEVFEEGDQWTVMVISTIETEETPTYAAMPVHLVSESEDFDSSYHNKRNISTVEAEGVTQVTTYPAFSLIPDNTTEFSTCSTKARYWRHQFASGDTVMFLGEEVNAVTMRRNEVWTFVFEDGVLHILCENPKAEKAGEFILADKKLVNTEYADGHEADIDDYQDLIDRLPASKKVTYSQWDEKANITIGNETFTRYKNRGKFAVDTLAGKFRFPDVRDQNFRSLKNIDDTTDSAMLSQGPGGAWAQDLLSHGHQVATTGNQATINPGRTLQRSGAMPVAGDTGYGEAQGYIIKTGGTRQMIDSIGQIALVGI